jgi:hypothetical protein
MGLANAQMTSKKLQLAEAESSALSKEGATLRVELEETKDELQQYKAVCDDFADDPTISDEPPAVTLEKRRSSIKRVATEALFDGERPVKRLKSEQSINIAKYVNNATATLYREATFMVLRHAGRGGLINPLHFTVSAHGLLCLTEHGQRRAALQAQPSIPFEEWRDEVNIRMTGLVKTIMTEAGFLTHGHQSMTLLVRALQNSDVVVHSTLAEEIRLVDDHTKSLREALQKNVQQTRQIEKNLRLTSLEVAVDQTNTLLPELVTLLKKLYAGHADGKLPSAWTVKTMFHSDANALATEGAAILASYDRLTAMYERIVKASEIPARYLPALEDRP